MESILLEKENGVARITLNRPQVYNSFDWEMIGGLKKALGECDKAADVRCVVLTGAGKAFSTGADLSKTFGPEARSVRETLEEGYNAIVLKIRHLEKPVVAAVNGVAAGAGLNIALACDIVVAAESASFMQAFVKVGLIPDAGGTWILPRLIGWQRASALLLTGERVSAKDALAMGMIYKVFPDSDFDAEVRQLSASLAQSATRALALTKKALNQTFANDLDTQLGRESDWQVAAAATADAKEGIAAFLEKRKPVFNGK